MRWREDYRDQSRPSCSIISIATRSCPAARSTPPRGWRSELRVLGYEVTDRRRRHRRGRGAAQRRRADRCMLRADMDGLPLRGALGPAQCLDARGRPTRPASSSRSCTPAATTCTSPPWSAPRGRCIARRGNWSGTLVLIAQPAEETISGARAMIAGRPLHPLSQARLCARLPCRRRARRPGGSRCRRRSSRPARTSVTILVHGIGTHGAYPHLGVDPVLVAVADRRVAPVDRQPRHQPARGRGDHRRLDPWRREEQHHSRSMSSSR